MLDKLSSLSRKLTPEMRRIVGNVGLLFAERFLTLLINFAVGIYTIRYLGSTDFGILSYSISLVVLFGSVATLGLRGIVVRDLVREESATDEILGTMLLLRLIGAAIAIVIITIAIFYLESQAEIRLLTMIISLQLLFVACDNPFELWFESQILSGKAGIVKVVQFLFASGIRLVLIWQKLPLSAFAWTIVAGSMIKFLGLLWLYLHQGKSPQHWQINLMRGKKMFSDAWPLIFSAIAVTLYMKIDQVMLGNMAGAAVVGNYAAAVKFSEVWYFIPLAISSSVFPRIIRAKQASLQQYYQQLQQLFDVMSWLSLTLAVGMSFVANPLINLFLGAEYTEAASILNIHIWAGIFVFLSIAQSKWLLEENMTRFSSISAACGAIANILLNLILIPRSGGQGAAIATLISYGISTYLCCILYPPTAKTGGWMLTKALFVPFRWRQNLLYLRQLKQYLL